MLLSNELVGTKAVYLQHKLSCHGRETPSLTVADFAEKCPEMPEPLYAASKMQRKVAIERASEMIKEIFSSHSVASYGLTLCHRFFDEHSSPRNKTKNTKVNKYQALLKVATHFVSSTCDMVHVQSATEHAKSVPVNTVVVVVGRDFGEVLLGHATLLLVAVAAHSASLLRLLRTTLLHHAAPSSDRLHLALGGRRLHHALRASIRLHHAELLHHVAKTEVLLRHPTHGGRRRSKRVVDTRDGRVVRVVGVVRHLVGGNRAVRVRICAVGHGVGVVKVRTGLGVCDDSTRSNARRRLVDRVGGEGGGVYSRHPQADLVQFVEVVDQVFEVDVMIRVVVKDQLLPVPRVRIR